MMVWSIPILNPVAARAAEAMAAKSSPPVMGSGMLYLERKWILRLRSVPMSSTTTAASTDPRGSRFILFSLQRSATALNRAPTAPAVSSTPRVAA